MTSYYLNVYSGETEESSLNNFDLIYKETEFHGKKQVGVLENTLEFWDCFSDWTEIRKGQEIVKFFAQNKYRNYQKVLYLEEQNMLHENNIQFNALLKLQQLGQENIEVFAICHMCKYISSLNYIDTEDRQFPQLDTCLHTCIACQINFFDGWL